MIRDKEDFKVKLEQYYDIKKEILETQTQIRKIEQKATVIDSVEASYDRPPYSKHNLTVQGHNHRLKQKLSQLQSILQDRYEELLDAQIEIEEFINTIPISRIRRIITMRHLNQFTWRKIAYMIGGRATEDSVRMEYQNFMKEN